LIDEQANKLMTMLHILINGDELPVALNNFGLYYP